MTTRKTNRVHSVLPGSAAAAKGLQVGDELLAAHFVTATAEQHAREKKLGLSDDEINAVVAIALALMGHGVWSIAWGGIVQSVTRCACMLVAGGCRWNNGTRNTR